jgi:hypothetical protein
MNLPHPSDSTMSRHSAGWEPAGGGVNATALHPQRSGGGLDPLVWRPRFDFETAICRTKGCGYVVTEIERTSIHEGIKRPRCGQCYVQMFEKLPPNAGREPARR